MVYKNQIYSLQLMVFFSMIDKHLIIFKNTQYYSKSKNMLIISKGIGTFCFSNKFRFVLNISSFRTHSYQKSTDILQMQILKEVLEPISQLQINQINIITMIDSQRNKRLLQTFNIAKRSQNRKVNSISHYSKGNNPFFGSLFEMVRVWQKQVKNRKPTKNSIFNTIDYRPKSQQPRRIVFPQVIQTKMISGHLNTIRNVFTVRVNSHCEKPKLNNLISPQKGKFKYLNVLSKTINGKIRERCQKQSKVLSQTNHKCSLSQRLATSKKLKIQKQQFQEDFYLTPWQLQ